MKRWQGTARGEEGGDRVSLWLGENRHTQQAQGCREPSPNGHGLPAPAPQRPRSGPPVAAAVRSAPGPGAAPRGLAGGEDTASLTRAR